MEYRLTEQQELVGKTVQSVLNKLIPDDEMRSILEREKFDKDMWKQLAGDGWLGILQAEEQDFDLMDLIQVSKAAGEKLYVAPLSLVASYVVPVLSKVLSESGKEKYLEPLVAGEALITTILPTFEKSEETAAVYINWNSVEAVEEAGKIRLNGEVKHVPFAQYADQILLTVENHLGKISVIVLDATINGVHIKEEESLDISRKLATVNLNDVAVDRENVITKNAEEIEQLLEKQLASYIQALNSEMIGGAEKILNMTIEFVNERKQFGQPIGVFQALKHQIADMVTGIENAKAYNNQTTWRLVNEDEFELYESLASRIYSVKVFKEVCESAIQLFGGMGFTWEQDIHFWYKSALYQQNHIAPVRVAKKYIFNNLKSKTPVQV